MIFLIITVSIRNKFGTQDGREERYMYAISETLKILPNVTTIIVENNGKRKTCLDTFADRAHIYYTDNNKYEYNSKGVNEFLDIKDVIRAYGIKNDDIIIKLTGRYRLLSSQFFDVINENYDAFVKFYEVEKLQFEKYDCVLGCYAIKAKYVMLFNHLLIDNYKSAEVAFAKYIKYCGAKLKEIEHLDVECFFPRILIV